MEDFYKIYGVCLERTKHQIRIAKNKIKNETHQSQDCYLLECYNTGDIDDIIDILELYDVEERTYQQITEKLDDLAYTISILTQERLFFDFTHEGYLGLYLSFNGKGWEDDNSESIQSEDKEDMNLILKESL